MNVHHRSAHGLLRARSRRSGFSLLELAVVLAIVSVALSMFAHTLMSSARLDPVAEEQAVAAEGARSALERMRNHPFRDVFKSYNANAADDPGGAGSAPGAVFDVPGLTARPGRNWVGEITFPSRQDLVREDYVDAKLGMPRDLNGDGLTDSADHTNDCIVLPIKIRLEWISNKGTGRVCSFEIYTMFADL